MSDALLTVKEVMARVRLSRPTIYRWMKTGKFPSARVLAPSCVRWRESEITNWIEQLPETDAE
jgi:prophage regulatory protein